MPISYVLINSNLGTDVQIIKEVKEMLADQNDVKLEIQGVYGVYDIIVKLSYTIFFGYQYILQFGRYPKNMVYSLSVILFQFLLLVKLNLNCICG